MPRVARIVITIMLSIVIVLMLLFFLVLPGFVDKSRNTVLSEELPSVSEEARRLHNSLTIADLHCDLLLWSRNPLERHTHGHADIPRLQEGNVALQVFSVVTRVPPTLSYVANEAGTDYLRLLFMAQRWPPSTWNSLVGRALYQASRLEAAAAESGGQLEIIRDRSSLKAHLARRAESPSLVGGLLAIEGLHCLEGDLANVDRLYQAGYRMMGLAHFFDTDVCGSAHGMEKGGLSELGIQVVRRMEALGIVIDLAHASPEAVDDVLDMAERPVVVSHTGVKGTCSGPRNLSDAQVRRIGLNGGVIGIGFWEGAVCGIDPLSIVRAMRHVVSLVGVDHVALGSDFDGAVHTRFDATGLSQITAALITAGFTEEEIAKIMGGNIIRVLEETLPQSQEDVIRVSGR